jgi:(4-(4-[2-(gamma-L-glutamylamino)ethyl]phenoxymethyl)furan-2-yl)methanamine synthase
VSGAILGWDVGGANVKAARIEAPAAEARTLRRPFALWREPGRLPEVLATLSRELGGAPRHAVTMTAELADCYATKREGVGAVLDAFAAAFPGSSVAVFGVDGRFHTPAEARRRPLRVAAANWMASATLVAETQRDAVLMDVGSTTTDIVPIVGGSVVAHARTDPGRLRSGELVYTGLLRTPVCAIVRSLPRRGRPCRVAAELFAIAADAHLWLGRIGAPEYACETPDGRGRTRRECGARLARMLAADDEMLDAAAIDAIARSVVAAQVRQIASGLRQVTRRAGPFPVAVLAGQGSRLAHEACEASGLRVFEPASEREAEELRAAPAVAVALLLRRV